jgi:hypothetical protein
LLSLSAPRMPHGLMPVCQAQATALNSEISRLRTLHDNYSSPSQVKTSKLVKKYNGTV